MKFSSFFPSGITGLLDYWSIFRWEITFDISQYIFFVSTRDLGTPYTFTRDLGTPYTFTRDLGTPNTFTRDLGAPDTYHIIEICLSYIFLKLINEVAFIMSTGKLFHLLITLKLKKFLLTSRLHSFEWMFIVHRGS